MRVLVIAGITLVATLLVCGMSVQVAVFGIQIDFLLLVMSSFVYYERSMLPVLFAGAGGIVMDVLFAPCYGFYSLPYLMAGLTVYFLYERIDRQKIYGLMIGTAAGWIAKELVTMLLCMFLSVPFSFGQRLFAVSLPGGLLHALLALIAGLLLRMLYRSAFMRPQKTFEDDLI